MSNVRTSATNRKIRTLLTAIRDKSLIPRPEFQRRLVWTNKHKIDFLDTVLNGYPFPEIYIAAADIDVQTGEGTEMLLDGQQRITTLNQYFTGSEELKLDLTIAPYDKLNPEEKTKFLEYEVVVRDLGNVGIEVIKEVFRRINATKYSLTAMEIHNARYDGEMKKFGEEIASLEFFEGKGIFSNNDIRRMNDTVYALTLIITIMSDYFNRDDELENYLEAYNSSFDEKPLLTKNISKVLSFIDKMTLPIKCRAWKKADFLNLFVEIHRIIVKEKMKLDAIKSSKRIISFYKRVDEYEPGDKVHDDIHVYKIASQQATNDKSRRNVRGEIVYKILCKM